MENYFEMHMTPQEIGEISVLGLAHLGDGVFELLVRSWLCAHGVAKSGDLHRATVRHVAAPAQAAFVERILQVLTPEELAYYKRGRNTHAQYAMATGLEALCGALYLLGARDRINELFLLGMEETNAL